MIDAASLGSTLLFLLAVGVCGWLAWPLAGLLLPGDGDRGYLAAKPLGWLLGSFAAWAASVAGVPFWRFGWVVGVAALAILFVFTRRRFVDPPPLVRILQWETAFAALLLCGVLIKGSAPDILGLEKFMDFGFINAALRSSAMPPPDPWWAGEPINYYYFGHVAAAWLIQLSRVPPDHGFNLMIALIFAFAAALSYRIVAGCLSARTPRVASACGVAAAALVTLGGNFHSVLYGPFRAFSPTSYDRDFFYPDSTRFVGFDPPTGDKGFTEMPGYGFAVGDLHAHVLNLPTAFLIVLILLRIVQREWRPERVGGVRLLEAGVLGLLFGFSAMCNSWDAASYAILMALAGLALLMRPGEEHRLALFGKLAGCGMLAVATAVLTAAPFLLSFKAIASGLRWSDGHTPLWQLAILYGHVALPCAVLLIGLFASPARRDGRWVAGALLAALAVCLVALPEIGYVKDIYGADHRRANTMFKLAFEAQPVAVMGGMILVGILLSSRRSAAALAACVLAVPLLAPLSYAENIYKGRVTPLRAHRFTLDGLGFVGRDRPDDAALIEWLRAQPPDRRILFLEAPGDSFTDSARLSAMSGVPTLLGWRGHEWLWRGDVGAVYGRGDRIAAFFRSKTLREACDFLLANGVTHLVVGDAERKSFPEMDEPLLRQLGPLVVQSGNSGIIKIDPASCRS